MIDNFDLTRSRTQTEAWNADLISNRPSKRRTDLVRIQKLDKLIETLKPKLRDALKEERQRQSQNMVGSMFSAVLWGTLLGNPVAGVAVASLSKNRKDGQISEESESEQLQTQLSAATTCRQRLAAASGYKDAVKPIPWKIVVICSSVLAIVILCILIGAAVSS